MVTRYEEDLKSPLWRWLKRDDDPMNYQGIRSFSRFNSELG